MAVSYQILAGTLAVLMTLAVIGLFTGIICISRGGRPHDGEHSFSRATVEVNVESTQVGECAICLDAIAAEDDIKQLQCQDRFHASCLSRWYRSQGCGELLFCPVCERPSRVYTDQVGSSESRDL